MVHDQKQKRATNGRIWQETRKSQKQEIGRMNKDSSEVFEMKLEGKLQIQGTWGISRNFSII